MAQWDDLSRDSLRAAGELMRNGRYRSSVSRAYYAAYAAVAGALAQRGMVFKEDRFGPSHHNAREMIEDNIGSLPRIKRKKLVAAMNRLYENRLDADYRPVSHVGLDTARDAITTASFVSGSLGVVN